MANVTKPVFKEKYGNFIGGKFVAPVKGQYFDNVSPVDGKVFTQAARSTQEDIDLALDAAHEAFPSWSTSSATERSNMLLKIAQVMELLQNINHLIDLIKLCIYQKQQQTIHHLIGNITNKVIFIFIMLMTVQNIHLLPITLQVLEILVEQYIKQVILEVVFICLLKPQQE